MPLFGSLRSSFLPSFVHQIPVRQPSPPQSHPVPPPPQTCSPRLGMRKRSGLFRRKTCSAPRHPASLESASHPPPTPLPIPPPSIPSNAVSSEHLSPLIPCPPSLHPIQNQDHPDQDPLLPPASLVMPFKSRLSRASTSGGQPPRHPQHPSSHSSHHSSLAAESRALLTRPSSAVQPSPSINASSSSSPPSGSFNPTTTQAALRSTTPPSSSVSPTTTAPSTSLLPSWLQSTPSRSSTPTPRSSGLDSNLRSLPSTSLLQPSSLQNRHLPSTSPLELGLSGPPNPKPRPLLSSAIFSSSSHSNHHLPPLEADAHRVTSPTPPSSLISDCSSPSSTRSHSHPSSSTTTVLSEEDKLRLSLERWKLDQDGVLRGGFPPLSSSNTLKDCQSPFAALNPPLGEGTADLQETVHPPLENLRSTRERNDVASSDSISSFFSSTSDLNESNHNLNPNHLNHHHHHLHCTNSNSNSNHHHLFHNPSCPLTQELIINPSDRSFSKPITHLTPKYHLAKNPPQDLSSSHSSSCLPSLVNPNRATMLPRLGVGAGGGPGEALDRSMSGLARLMRSSEVDLPLNLSTAPPSSSLKPLSCSTSTCSQNLDYNDLKNCTTPSPSSPKRRSGSISSPNLSDSTVVQSSQGLVTRSNSMKEGRDQPLTYDLVGLRTKLRRRGYTDEDAAGLAIKVGESLYDLSRSSSISNRRPSSATTCLPSSSTLASLQGSQSSESESDGQLKDRSSRLPPTIRLVSPLPQASPSEPETSPGSGIHRSVIAPNVSGSSSFIPISSPPSHSSTTNQSIHSNKIGHVSDRVHPSPASFKSPAGSRPHTVMGDLAKHKVTKAGYSKQPGPSLSTKPTISAHAHRHPKPQPIPQLHRSTEVTEKSTQSQQPTLPEDRRAPRAHQSSPNLRNTRSPSPSDFSFFSVIVSGPTGHKTDQPSTSSTDTTTSQNESGHLTVMSDSHSYQSSSTSLSLAAQPDSAPSNLPHSLVVPGLTVEENASRLAELFWLEDKSIIKPQKLTEWLGSPDSTENRLQVLTRKAFMDKFDLKDLRIDMAFRRLCSKMYLKGETQQVDRILAEFSRRYWQQNQSHIYVNSDMVHALSYSILLLNTDLHVVDTVSRMSRSQFIRNTMETIYAQLSPSGDSQLATNLFAPSLDSSRPSTISSESGNFNPKQASNPTLTIRSRRTSIVDLTRSIPSVTAASLSSTRPSMERWREAFRSGSQLNTKSSRRSQSITSCPSEEDSHGRGSFNLSHIDSFTIKSTPRHSSVDGHTSYLPTLSRPEDFIPSSSSSPTPIHQVDMGTNVMGKVDSVSKAQFARELETLLKDIYSSIKTQPIFQNSFESSRHQAGSYGSLQRAPSRRVHHSAAPDLNGPLKRASLRGFGGLAAILSTGSEMPAVRPGSPTPSGSSTSLSGSSLPSGMMGYSSNAGSSLNLTNPTSPSVGFVSNLSQSIIREQHEDETLEAHQPVDVQLSDSDLALLGAPWAKEGILQRKQYWESKGKRHKDRGWAQVFVVIQTGVLKMFQFGLGGGSSGTGLPPASPMSPSQRPFGSKVTVGGGNWLPNAQLLGGITLSHALTSLLVSGYSKERPHVFVLTLSNGASYFFQAGTEELVHEWVSTCNYWAARLSKEPLTGGVSNMEYGWNQLLDLDLSASNSDKKEESPDHQQDHDEMVSIMSGQSGHSHKASRRLRDRWFNGLPLGSPMSPPVPNHSPRASDPQCWSSGGGIGTDAPQPVNSSPGFKGGNSTLVSERTSSLGLVNVPDKLIINDWNPPVPPMALSNLPEDTQLENLKRHTSHIQAELEKHNLLRRPMINLYWNRATHLQKAMSNWEKKSQYLMAEIIKYTTYLNALESTIKLKQSMITHPKPHSTISATMTTTSSSSSSSLS